MKITGTLKTTLILMIIFAALKAIAGGQSNDFEKVVYMVFVIYRYALAVIGIFAVSDWFNKSK